MGSTECTGISASWCPNHGDCTCPRREDGEAVDLDDDSCPLHAATSDHGEGRWDCARCRASVLLDPELEVPAHRLCHVCASDALDDAHATLAEMVKSRDTFMALARLHEHVGDGLLVRLRELEELVVRATNALEMRSDRGARREWAATIRKELDRG